MTAVVGLVIAIVVGLVAPSLRAALLSQLALMLTAAAIQTWDIGAGLGRQSPDVAGEVGYYVVQVVIMAVIASLTALVFFLRNRRREQPGTRFAGRRGLTALALGEAGLTAFGMVLIWVLYDPATNGTGNGHAPLRGVIGIWLGVALILVTGAYAAVSSGRRSRRPAGAVQDRS